MEQSDLKTFCEALHEKFSSQYDFENLDNIIVRCEYFSLLHFFHLNMFKFHAALNRPAKILEKI